MNDTPKIQHEFDDSVFFTPNRIIREAEDLAANHPPLQKELTLSIPDDIQKIWKEILITEEPPEEIPLISIGGVSVATPNNHSLVLGKKKSRKTLFIVLLVNKFLSQ
jgi:hypothetical protein